MHFTENHTLPSQDPNWESGDVLVLESGRYKVEAKLGEGSFGSVYLVHHLDTQAEFAFKLLHLRDIETEQERLEISNRFKREYRAGQISSPYIIKSHYRGKVEGNPYILMDYCSGGNLALHKEKYREEKEFEKIAIGILFGLKDLHHAGIIHRDIKPSNILFDAEGKVYLSDFGISGFLSQRMTRPNFYGHVDKVWGTIVYMPPEQHNVETAFRSLGPVTDIFAFGVLAYEILTGKFPYGGMEDFKKDKEAFYRKVRKGVFEPIANYRPHLSPVWIKIIESSLAAYPEKRIQTPQEILGLLGNPSRRPYLSDKNKLSPAARAAKRSSEWILRVVHGERGDQVFKLDHIRKEKNKNILRLGRATQRNPQVNDINILDEQYRYISQKHATLEYREGHWYIRDGQWIKYEGKSGWKYSKNGTKVNFQEVPEGNATMLQPNDIIMVGDTRLKVEVIYYT